MFDRFFRGDQLARHARAAGSASRSSARSPQQHGGSATVANAPDGGAVFRLHLPVATASAEELGEPTETGVITP